MSKQLSQCYLYNTVAGLKQSQKKAGQFTEGSDFSCCLSFPWLGYFSVCQEVTTFWHCAVSDLKLQCSARKKVFGLCGSRAFFKALGHVQVFKQVPGFSSDSVNVSSPKCIIHTIAKLQIYFFINFIFNR